MRAYNDFALLCRTYNTAVYIRLARYVYKIACTSYLPAVLLPVYIISSCSWQNIQQQHSSSNLDYRCTA